MYKRDELSLNQEILLKRLPDYVSYAKRAAGALFNRLDGTLDPQVIILAIPFRKGFETVVTQPESSGYDPNWFVDVRELVEGIPESYLADSPFDVQGVTWQEKVKVKKRLQKILNSKLRETGWVGFTTYPEFMHGYSVSFIIDVSGSALESHYALLRNTFWGVRGHFLNLRNDCRLSVRLSPFVEGVRPRPGVVPPE